MPSWAGSSQNTNSFIYTLDATEYSLQQYYARRRSGEPNVWSSSVDGDRIGGTTLGAF
jgi:hypothetical protein